MSIHIQKGDLLEQKVDAIVNTVNCVGIMGKGIALQFKKKWPENFKAYAKACKLGEVKTGKMFIHDNGGLVEPHFIINFPTKNHWRGASKIEFIEEGLKDLAKQIKEKKIQSIAIPPLGCGNGGLAWTVVKERIETAFKEIPDVEVKLFEPFKSPEAKELKINTPKPALTVVRAAIIKLVSIYRELDYELSMLEVQKLAYLLTVTKNDDFKLKFSAHAMGPYSENLKHAIDALDGHYLQGVGDFTGPSQLTLSDYALKEAEEFLKEEKELNYRIKGVENLIQGFQTPYGMELLSTVHWVLRGNPKPKTYNDVLNKVHSWNNRKKQIMSKNDIKIAIDHLTKNNFALPN